MEMRQRQGVDWDLSWRRLTPRNENGYDSASSRHKRGLRTGSVDLLLLIRKRTSGGSSSSAEEQERRQGKRRRECVGCEFSNSCGTGGCLVRKAYFREDSGMGGGGGGSGRTPTTHPPKTKTKRKKKKKKPKQNKPNQTISTKIH